MAQIQSNIFKDNTIRLFVVARIDIENDIRNFANYDSLLIANPNRHEILDTQCISEFYHIYVDNSLAHDLEWTSGDKAHTKQIGYFTNVIFQS